MFNLIDVLNPLDLCLMCAAQFCKLQRYLVLRWASTASLYALEHQLLTGAVLPKYKQINQKLIYRYSSPSPYDP